VREALKLLTLSGLLEARRGSGTYVRENYVNFVANQMEWPTLLKARDVDLIFEVREALELQTARLAAERATPEEVEAIAVYRRLLDLEGRDVERETEIDLEFHRAIAVAAHNGILLQLMNSLENLLREYITLSNAVTDNVKSTVAEHDAVYEAIQAKDPDAAARAMASHLAISRIWIVQAAALNGRDVSAAEGEGDESS
jgi:GntR family transcriptional repressor for pyruvate dehydrogenase complex